MCTDTHHTCATNAGPMIFNLTTQLWHLGALRDVGLTGLWLDASWFKGDFGPNGFYQSLPSNQKTFQVCHSSLDFLTSSLVEFSLKLLRVSRAADHSWRPYQLNFK